MSQGIMIRIFLISNLMVARILAVRDSIEIMNENMLMDYGLVPQDEEEIKMNSGKA